MADDGHATATALPNALQVLAEVELLRAKTSLMERRVAAWENELVELKKVISVLEKQRDPSSSEWEASLRDLDHRVGRLERRREAAAQDTEAAARALPLPATQAPSYDLDSVAIVRPRWVPTESAPGDTVQLMATSDGIAGGTEVKFTIRSLVEETPLATIVGKCDGDTIVAKWKVPNDPKYRELYFEVAHEGIAARSPVLILPV